MPTEKQKRVAEILGKNGGKSVSKAMIEAGYSPATAKNPDKLTTSQGWAELMDKYIPEDKLMDKLKEGLEAYKVHTSHTEADSLVPDFPTRHKYLETGWKLRKRLGNNDEAVSSDLQVNILVYNETEKEIKKFNYAPEKSTTEESIPEIRIFTEEIEKKSEV